ncbi:MAG TPA: hypothetical protein VFQ45_11850 [Longimicrobium sp.]|nr:hypothetical protein [Longimicrobium sp.]
MKKLSLCLDELCVESFDTTPAAKNQRGTVHAEQCTCPTNCTCPGCPSCDASCPWTCPWTCDDNTCISCANTCQNTGCTRYQPCWE